MVLLSESCLPLYPPTLVYAQLISEPKSRINGCHDWVHSPSLSMLGHICIWPTISELHGRVSPVYSTGMSTPHVSFCMRAAPVSMRAVSVSGMC